MQNKDYRHRRAFSEIQECIQKENDFLITTHIHPDGDSIASILLFASLLKHLGKRYLILLADDVPKKFDFLWGVDEILCLRKRTFTFDPRVSVVLDSSDLERIGDVRHLIPTEAIIINIDHHPSNPAFGKLNMVDENESSTVEIVYTLFKSFQVPMSPEIATLVYTGIVCDTGRFLFPNTTFKSFSVCTEMVKMGALPNRIAEKLYCRASQSTIRALAAALSTLEFHFDGSVSCIHLSNGFFSSNDGVDTEGFVDYLLTIEGTEVEFFMYEKKPNLFRVSFRSKRTVDVNEVAKTLGGGGHTRAAGCTLQGTLEEVKGRILNVLKDHL